MIRKILEAPEEQSLCIFKEINALVKNKTQAERTIRLKELRVERKLWQNFNKILRESFEPGTHKPL